MKQSLRLRRRQASLAVLACLAGPADAAGIRAKADVTCQPAADKLQYDCIIRLTNSRTNEPLTGATLTVFNAADAALCSAVAMTGFESSVNPAASTLAAASSSMSPDFLVPA